VYNPGHPVGVLGKGNFGCVYKACGHGKAWAIKHITNVSTYAALTKNEIEVLGLLAGHPNIIGLADTIAHPSQNSLFLVMEFVEGGDLLGALTNYPYLFDEALVRGIMFYTSCALGYAHERNVMHRDVKPENILLTKDLVPKVADFGLARTLGSNETCRTLAGSPGYMAPEVLDTRVPYDFPADIFSLGLVFADMVNEKCCCQWWLAVKPEPVKERYLKKWPSDKVPAKMSAITLELQHKLISHVPGERLTAYQFCHELLKLAEADPMPCKLWSVSPKMPAGPPAQKMISPMEAADIAGRLGYAKGSPVLVRAEGQWREGVVDHISTMLCPGAAQVRFQGEQGATLILVPPAQFTELLRPALKVPNSLERSVITMAGDLRPEEQKEQKPTEKRKPAPTASTRCKNAGCCVQ
jgi:serine/threonine protein kinase